MFNIFKFGKQNAKISSAEQKAFSGRREYLFKTEIKITPKDNCENIEIWQAIPTETGYQGALKTEFSPEKPAIIDEKTFGNKIAYWAIEKPKAREKITFCQKTNVWVEPRVVEPSGVVSDYNKNDPVYKLFTKEDRYFNYVRGEVGKLTDSLVGSETQIPKITKKLYDYVRDTLAYGNPIEGLYTSTDALKLPEVDCGGFDTLLGAMFRRVGIPARLLSGFLAGYGGEHIHAWLEFMNPNGTWVPVDPSTEKLRESDRDFKPGGFGKIGNDRIVVSISCDIVVDQKIFTILQTPFIQSTPKDSVSVDRIIEAE